MSQSVKVFVSGKVQGVCYRVWAKEQAEQLGVTGYVRNLTNGNVEVVLVGEQEQIDAMLEAMREGPPDAEVDDLQVHQIDESKSYSDFSIFRTTD